MAIRTLRPTAGGRRGGGGGRRGGAAGGDGVAQREAALLESGIDRWPLAFLRSWGLGFDSFLFGGVARTNYTIQTQVAVSLYVKADRDKTCVGVVGTELVVTANWASL